jgi:hemolysin III
METFYTTDEERINWITHAIGVVLSIGGLVTLIICSAICGGPWHVVSFTVFGSTLISLYTVSTFYHFVTNTTIKKILRSLDLSAIFMLIAGTYTPFMLVSIRGPWGWSILGFIWIYALLGSITAIFFIGTFMKMSVGIYMTMGWICIIALRELALNLSWISFTLLFVGGLAYTLGVIFFACRKVPYNHAIWHIFVLLGSIFHYFSILLILWPEA